MTIISGYMAYGASLLVIDLFRLLLGNESGSIRAVDQINQ